MTKVILSILLLFTISIGNGQDLSAWDYQVLEKANTAKNVGYLTANEKKMIQLINLARIDGAKFYETIAKPYIDTATSSSYTRSLASVLKKVKGLPLLSPDKILFEAAQKYAISMGKSGKIGHDKYAQRMKPIQNKYKGLSENCDYGFEGALTIVMRLLIDEGNPDYGHRKAILDPNFVFIGVSIKRHTKWDWNCVQEFGGVKL
ncbi:MAG: CAP domain-containing protein [Flavobacteriales bacterium]|nr:CAP domain-containing protein [Flavobacteriales bacterium]